jgi:methylenetetrahydrofolate--tRNA-(uracil-5-)-methyltransferase
MSDSRITIIGGGLAGCEAAWQAAREGAVVTLYEMKPQRFSPAHHSPNLGELVCSNSLRAMNNAVGCLKEEPRCGSLFMAAADATAVPAGGALAVDREAFAPDRQDRKPSPSPGARDHDHPRGDGHRRFGPLTSGSEIARWRRRDLYFYDAIAPITGLTYDFTGAWRASRYGKGGDDYVNCP